MRNTQIGRGLVVAMMLGVTMIAARPAFADSGMGGPKRDTCFFAQGIIDKVPDVPGRKMMVAALIAATGCDGSNGDLLHE